MIDVSLFENKTLYEVVLSAFNSISTKISGSGITIICPNKKSILLGKRNNPDMYAGCWCSFGGTVEENEDILKTAIREIKEETNINPSIISSPKELYLDINNDGFRFMNYLSTCDEEFNISINDEHSDYGWFPIMNLPAPMHPGMNRMFADPIAMRSIIKTIVGIQ